MNTRLGAVYPELAGKRVLVTGGASGIGLCFLEAFLAQGCAVVAVDRDPAAIAAARERLDGHDAVFIEADLAQAGNAGAVVRQAAVPDGLDILITNAANDTRHAWNDVTEASWRGALAINLDHQFFCAQAAALIMEHHRSGVIIFIGSVTARRPRGAMVGYIAAKSAIEGMTRALARELSPAGIRVTAIIPGAIDTPRQQALWRTPEIEAQIRKDQATPELLDGWDVAALALFLSSAGARGCTGQTYSLDGGLT